jgi:anthranilate phosphoribosyltransferase
LTGKVAGLEEGISLAREAIDSGAAAAVLQKLRAFPGLA